MADGTKPTLVSVEKDRNAPQDSFTVEAGVGTVEVRYEVLPDKVRLSINGQHVKDLPRDFLQVPGFRSPYSGSYSITRTIARTGYPPSQATYHYKQKSLRFLQEFPVYDLQSSEPVHITNSFGWDDGSPVEAAYWRVTVDGSEVKAGLSTEISAVWSPTDGILARAAGPGQGPVSLAPGVRAQGAFQTLPYEVRASAVAFQRGGINEIPYEISSSGSVPGLKELRIVDERITPDPPFEEPDSSVTLTAKVIAIALEIDPETVEWTVDLKDQDGATVVEDLAVGTGPDVSAVWDGKINGQAMPNPTFYKFKITATACEGGIVVGGRAVRGQDVVEIPSECPFGYATVAMQSELLEFFGEDSEALLATSEAGAPDVVATEAGGLPTFGAASSGNSVARGLNLGVPNNSFAQKVPGMDYGVIVALSGVSPAKQEAESVVVKLRTTASGGGASRNVELFPGTHPKTGVRCFLRTIYLSDSSSGGADPKFAIQPFAQSFSSFDATGTAGRLQDSKRFIQIQSGIGREKLGETHDFPEDTTSYQETTPISVDAFRAAGYESLVGTYGGKECWVRVRNQAKVFYVSAHGWHDDNLIHFDSGGEVYPSTDLDDPSGLTKEDWQNDKLDTVIMAACSVLDMGNWNDGEHAKTFRTKSPGWAWANITKPSTILLGYNAQAPDAEETDQEIERRDTRILERFYEQIDKGDHPTLAWLRGNARMETRLGDNASAILGEYYYFIKFKRKNDFIGPGFIHTQRQIWKLHYSLWNGDKRWETLPEGPGGAIWVQDLPDQRQGEEHRDVF